jgi:hypothetical protein
VLIHEGNETDVARFEVVTSVLLKVEVCSGVKPRGLVNSE